MASVKLSGELMQEVHQICHWNELVTKSKFVVNLNLTYFYLFLIS